MTTDETVHEVFRTVFNDDDIVLSDDYSAADRSDWDSIAHLNLMFALEQSLGVTFSGNEFMSLSNVGELRQLLRAKLGSPTYA
ncbi:acyl carrier protein [Salinarimonas soli]|uniref:Acyl carrier protein n=1 Tax=Salinarimonas soli TaxID=1638099 RepID=A0A5B2V326_9HYPH|nr:acyl carrier protein [Salinarimonas soli]KAA2233444.1 acyl carrier protein [Salinarimonas soli]